MWIKRDIDAFLDKRMFGGKTIVIYGPRQAGKTSAVRNYIQRAGLANDVAFFNGDEAADRETLADASAARIKALVGGKRVLFVDEAQRVPEIGMVLKRIKDGCGDLQTVATGSSSVELAEKIEEPMTGRKFEYLLMPLSFAELASETSPLDEMRETERRLVFGSYPDVVAHPGDEIDRLQELGKGYLYKDILKLDGLRRPETLDRLARALAFQIGQEVSFAELAQTCGTDAKTAAKYVDILEKAYIVRRLPSFARNGRNELKKSRKIYFLDCGIRNYVLGDWRPVAARSPEEAGKLWENHLVSERFKRRLVREPTTRDYFWRTAQQQEVDLVEENASGIKAFEFKWNAKKAGSKVPKTFAAAYPDAEFKVVTPADAAEFLL